MTHLKQIVLALALATACAVAPPALRGFKDIKDGKSSTVGDTFEMSLAKEIKNDAALAVDDQQPTPYAEVTFRRQLLYPRIPSSRQSLGQVRARTRPFPD